jgi:AcrR family transcriptional regulator
MGRVPKARCQVLEAAERVVRERGAAALTFDEVVAESGITRGGITYHFPTKDDLLRALVERDRERWEHNIAAHKARAGCPHSGDVIAYIRAAAEHDDEHRRFVAGMLSAVAHDERLLDGCRDLYRAEIGASRWTDDDLRRLILTLAADGLFWMEQFRFLDLPAGVRKRLIAMLEQLAREWTSAPAAPTVKSPKSVRQGTKR